MNFAPFVFVQHLNAMRVGATGNFTFTSLDPAEWYVATRDLTTG